MLKKIKEITGCDALNINKGIKAIKDEYQESNSPFFIQEIAKGYVFAVKPEYSKWIKKLYSDEKRYFLSKASIETLAIIAYNQPVTRTRIENIRGVNCSGILLNLLKNDFIRVSGKDKSPGNPLLYKVTEKFLFHFGLKNISDLPPIRELELENEENEITEIFSNKRD